MARKKRTKNGCRSQHKDTTASECRSLPPLTHCVSLLNPQVYDYMLVFINFLVSVLAHYTVTDGLRSLLRPSSLIGLFALGALPYTWTLFYYFEALHFFCFFTLH